MVSTAGAHSRCRVGHSTPTRNVTKNKPSTMKLPELGDMQLTSHPSPPVDPTSQRLRLACGSATLATTIDGSELRAHAAPTPRVSGPCRAHPSARIQQPVAATPPPVRSAAAADRFEGHGPGRHRLLARIRRSALAPSTHPAPRAARRRPTPRDSAAAAVISRGEGAWRNGHRHTPRRSHADDQDHPHHHPPRRAIAGHGDAVDGPDEECRCGVRPRPDPERIVVAASQTRLGAARRSEGPGLSIRLAPVAATRCVRLTWRAAETSPAAGPTPSRRPPIPRPAQARPLPRPIR